LAGKLRNDGLVSLEALAQPTLIAQRSHGGAEPVKLLLRPPMTAGKLCDRATPIIREYSKVLAAMNELYKLRQQARATLLSWLLGAALTSVAAWVLLAPLTGSMSESGSELGDVLAGLFLGALAGLVIGPVMGRVGRAIAFRVAPGAIPPPSRKRS